MSFPGDQQHHHNHHHHQQQQQHYTTQQPSPEPIQQATLIYDNNANSNTQIVQPYGVDPYYASNLSVVVDDRNKQHLHVYNPNTGGYMDVGFPGGNSNSSNAVYSTQHNNNKVKPKLVRQHSQEEMKELIELVGASSYYVQAVKNFSYMLTQFYSVMVGALLVIFVPQECCLDYTTVDNGITVNHLAPYGQCTPDTQVTSYLCGYNDEITNLSFINEVALDPLLSEVAIRKEWPTHADLQYYMNRKNRHSFLACVTGVCFQVVNIILSGYIIFHYYYAGSKSAIGFISNILIQGAFVFKGAETAYIDWRHHLARTILASEPISYNKVNPNKHK